MRFPINSRCQVSASMPAARRVGMNACAPQQAGREPIARVRPASSRPAESGACWSRVAPTDARTASTPASYEVDLRNRKSRRLGSVRAAMRAPPAVSRSAGAGTFSGPTRARNAAAPSSLSSPVPTPQQPRNQAVARGLAPDRRRYSSTEGLPPPRMSHRLARRHPIACPRRRAGFDLTLRTRSLTIGAADVHQHLSAP